MLISSSHLEAVRTALGPVVHLDLGSSDAPTAHRQLGVDVAGQIDRFVAHRLLSLPEAALRAGLSFARRCEYATRRKLNSRRLASAVRAALETYLVCLEAWSDGALLEEIAQRRLGNLQLEGGPVRPMDLAFFLQSESAGCQTGMLRDRDGGVLLWHTEEDRDLADGARFDRLRLFTCPASPESTSATMTAFIYPDLLPGPAFGWSGEGYTHAVDAFYLRPDDHLEGVPANAVTWICLYLGGTLPASEVLASLGPIHSGYALSSVCRGSTEIHATLTEFLGESSVGVELGNSPGAWTFQVNMLSRRAATSAPGREGLGPDLRIAQAGRRARASRGLRSITGSSMDWEGRLQRLLAFRVGGSFATANPSVKATFLGRMSPSGTTYRVDPGPSMRDPGRATGTWCLLT